MKPTTISRRDFVGASATGFAGLVCSVRAGAQVGPKAEVLETKVISLDTANYHGWPTVTRRRNGQLVVVCSGGREAHVCPFGRVDMYVSNDNGRTWGWPRTLLDSDIDDRDSGDLGYPSTVELDGGTLLTVWYEAMKGSPAAVLRQAKWKLG